MYICTYINIRKYSKTNKIEILAKERKNSLKPCMKIRLWGNGISNKWAQAIIDNMELPEWVEVFLQEDKITSRKFRELRKWMKLCRK